MIHIEPTTDAAFIVACITHPRVWPHVSCDGLDPSAFDVAPHLLYLCPTDGGDRLGVFVIEMHSPHWAEVHTALLPQAWGSRAAAAAQALLRWLAAAGIRKLTTVVPDGNALALRFARAAGLREEGRIAASLMRGGQMVDQTLLGVELCQQQP